MSATEALRASLTALGIEYGRLGEYATRVAVGGLSWLVQDNLDGTMDATTCVCDATPDEVMQAITGRGTATMRTVCDDDGVGHSECGACGRVVGEWFKYCPGCGCRFTAIERTYIP